MDVCHSIALECLKESWNQSIKYSCILFQFIKHNFPNFGERGGIVFLGLCEAGMKSA